jgi:polyhydroxybutyrate depolymerase
MASNRLRVVSLLPILGGFSLATCSDDQTEGLGGTGGSASLTGGTSGGTPPTPTGGTTGGTKAATGGVAPSGGTVATGGVTGGTGGQGKGGATAGSAGATAKGGSGGGGGAAGGGSGGVAGGSGGGMTGNTTPCEKAGTLKAGDSLHMLTVGSQNYPFNIHVPASYDGMKRFPFLFDFHGLGGNENQMQRLSGWAAVGDMEGFITVFPGGPSNGWNAGGCCTQTATDLDFVKEAIKYMDSNGCVDTKRVYASGCSNGGAMSFRVACEAADVIAAVAPVDFDCVVGGRCASCMPARPITEIQFRGTSDSAVPYSGAMPNFERWGEINKCTGMPETWSENSSCMRHTGCEGGVETILCSVQNGSHCGSYMSFSIAKLAWSVIGKYSLP